MEEGAKSFYSGEVPPVVACDRGSLPEAGLGVIPCSEAFLAAYSAPLGSPSWCLRDGCVYLNTENQGEPAQMALFGD